MVEIKKLKCGITLVSEEMANMKSTSMGLWVKAGAVDESSKLAGISHFIEHMMFKGTENRTAKELAEDVDKIGAQINAFTGKEATCYYIKSLESNVNKSMDILMDMFKNSLLDPVELEREKMVIFEEMKMIQDTPDEYAQDLICETVFQDLPLGNSIIGTPSSLKPMTSRTLRKYIKDQYTNDRIVFSIAGNFHIGQVEEKLEKFFGDNPLTGKKLELVEKEHKPRYKVRVRDIEQSHICLAIPTVEMDHPDYQTISVLANIMGGTMSSRFFQNIREQKGLAYSVYGVNSSFAQGGFFDIYAGVSHDKIGATINAIKHELKLLAAEGVTVDELNKAKEQLKSTYIFGLENVNGRMFSMGRSVTLLGEVKTSEEVINAIDSVFMEQVERVADRICRIEEYSGVVVTNKKVNLRKMIQG